MTSPRLVVNKATLTYPKGLPQMLKMSEDEFVEELRFLAAAKLYELGRLTAGKAAQLAEMNRLDFIYRLGTIGVPAINLRDEEVEAEVQAARDMAQ